jgi:hypothetical protein
MSTEMENSQDIEVFGSIKPWVDLANEYGMTEHRVFKDVLKAFAGRKAGTVTEQEYQNAMQAFIDACSAKATSETPRL